MRLAVARSVAHTHCASGSPLAACAVVVVVVVVAPLITLSGERCRAEMYGRWEQVCAAMVPRCWMLDGAQIRLAPWLGDRRGAGALSSVISLV